MQRGCPAPSPEPPAEMEASSARSAMVARSHVWLLITRSVSPAATELNGWLYLIPAHPE